MASNKYHGADADVTLTTESGTSITVGELRGVTITGQVELDDLDTADSIKRSAIKQRKFRVLVEATNAAWDTALLQQWLGGSGSSSTGMVDTTDPAQFEVTGTVTPEGGGTDLKAVVEEVVFPEMPFFSDISHDAWVEHNISGTGKDITLTGPS